MFCKASLQNISAFGLGQSNARWLQNQKTRVLSIPCISVVEFQFQISIVCKVKHLNFDSQSRKRHENGNCEATPSKYQEPCVQGRGRNETVRYPGRMRRGDSAVEYQWWGGGSWESSPLTAARVYRHAKIHGNPKGKQSTHSQEKTKSNRQDKPYFMI